MATFIVSLAIISSAGTNVPATAAEVLRAGPYSVRITADGMPGDFQGPDGKVLPATIRKAEVRYGASANPVKIGCEQHGGGRWFFNGDMADVRVLDRALPIDEIATLAKGERKDAQTFEGKAGKPLTAPQFTLVTVSRWKPTRAWSTNSAACSPESPSPTPRCFPGNFATP
jgi:hypothetical protein